MNKRKLLEKVLAGPKNVHFNDMISLVHALTTLFDALHMYYNLY